MSVQLRTIIATLNEHSVLLGEFWNLTGIDGDIDIGIWAKDEARMKTIFPSMKKIGYRIKIRSYHGIIFTYKFMPGKNLGSRSLDINMFRQAGEFAWCPQPHPTPNTYKAIHPQLFRIVRGIL